MRIRKSSNARLYRRKSESSEEDETGLEGDSEFNESMEQGRAIKRGDVIGKRIRFVLQRDLLYHDKEEYQEREIIVELESGLRFSLDGQAEVLDAATGFGLIFPYAGKDGLYCEIDARSDANLSSPIEKMIRPYGYRFSCGVVLGNGFILIGGFDIAGNGALFMRPCPETMALMEPFELPA